jgi:hypothetical protein
MSIKDTLTSRAFKRCFKDADRRGQSELQLSFEYIEIIIGKKLPSLAKSQGAKDVHWNDASEISGQWREFGYSITKYDHKRGEITFIKNDAVKESFLEMKKARDKIDKELLKEDLSVGVKKLIPFGIFVIIVLMGFKSCEDSMDASRINDPCRKLGLESNWNNTECR